MEYIDQVTKMFRGEVGFWWRVGAGVQQCNSAASFCSVLALPSKVKSCWGHYVKWNKPDRKGQIPYDSTYMWYLWQCAQSHLILCDSRDCSPQGSSVHRILPAGILGWVVISSSRGFSQPQKWNPCLLHWQVDSLPLRSLERPNSYRQKAEWWLAGIVGRRGNGRCCLTSIVSFCKMGRVLEICCTIMWM